MNWSNGQTQHNTMQCSTAPKRITRTTLFPDLLTAQHSTTQHNKGMMDWTFHFADIFRIWIYFAVLCVFFCLSMPLMFLDVLWCYLFYFWFMCEFGRIRAAIHIRVRPDSGGRPISEFGRIQADGWVRPDSSGIVQGVSTAAVAAAERSNVFFRFLFEKPCRTIMKLLLIGIDMRRLQEVIPHRTKAG